jgi:hypothetical protein
MDEREGARDKRYAELVGEKLRKMRQERGMSLQEVCSRSGGSFVVSTLSAYERGKRSLSLERLNELANIYGQSPNSILDVDNQPDFQRSGWIAWPSSVPRRGGLSRPTWTFCASFATTPRATCSPSARKTWCICRHCTACGHRPSRTTSRRKGCFLPRRGTGRSRPMR